MNNKGEMNFGTIGMFLMAFVAVIVGIAMLQSSSGFIGTATQTYTTLNLSVVPSATANDTVDIRGQSLITQIQIVNNSGATVNCANNYTLVEGVSKIYGVKRVQMKTLDGDKTFCGRSMNVSYVWGDEGYIESSGGRGIASVILIFFGLGIAVVALVPALRSGLGDLFGGR